ncbi:SlyX family protein [Desulfobaculum bizertense]|uniref:SlyX protein n=1 Tax=Desulfobaculum bizertense DSM 18034 TaxID=1121442 RepID=A0A1T4VDW9_9BACT|nr:SlyX family protein [Desulfobaculum bizertense]UIJ37636.1 SlyX family protein [Desulfobaculum bizertense]SKA63150.1 SlyX protein [Desulfobaculum bizertense DSM 18034]
MERTLEERIIRLESDTAMNLKVIDDLNDVIASQQKQIDRMERQLERVTRKLLEIDYDEGGNIPDPPPPHYSF